MISSGPRLARTPGHPFGSREQAWRTYWYRQLKVSPYVAGLPV